MELSWSTFLLEIINFLILVWILKHFFYAPVVSVIERRRKGIEDSLAQADAMRSEAKQVEDQYKARLSQWETEKKQAREALDKEINDERARLMEALQSAVDKEREKAKVLETRRVSELQRKNEQQAMNNAAQFTSKLLGRLASPEMENKICELLLEELPRLPPERLEALGNVFSSDETPIAAQAAVKVSSAYDLTEQCCNSIKTALSDLVGKPIECKFARDPQLIAGLRINFGPLVLRANLHDELQLFIESANESA
ncbi:MAG: F0F1 ATP synthase subunit delta [Gammaproteobacteria bacterium]|nr:F0F1 ATP synthase subunit delta [Gammaproteobacteria bacterium]